MLGCYKHRQEVSELNVCVYNCSVLPFALLSGQLSRGLQVFVDEIFLYGGQTWLISAVVHGVLAFTLNTTNMRSHGLLETHIFPTE